MKTYQFGFFQLDSQSRLLTFQNKEVNLLSKGFDILLLLVKNQGAVLTKDRLMEEIWGDRFVEENNLTVQIFHLRKTLAKYDKKSKFIKTVSGRGYCFVGKITEVEELPNESLKTETFGEKLNEESIAVLPLLNANSASDIDYLADGLTESIINNISELTQLKVLAKNTVFRYRQKQINACKVGLFLKVNFVLLGQIFLRQNFLVISCELIQVRDGTQVWGKTYQIDFSYINLINEDIAKEIVSNLKLKLTVAQHKKLAKRVTENSEAYRLYLKGNHLWTFKTEEALDKSISFFERAIALDKDFTLAYVGLANSYKTLLTYFGQNNQQTFDKIRQNLKKAIELDKGCSEAFAALGSLRLYEWQWTQAGLCLEKALLLNPNNLNARHWLGTYLTIQGKFEEALSQLNQALVRDPLSPSIGVAVSGVYYLSRNYEKCRKYCEDLLEINHGFWAISGLHGLALLETGEPEKSVETLLSNSKIQKSAENTAVLGYVYARMNSRDLALKVVESLKNDYPHQSISFSLATIYCGLEETEKAIHHLQKAFAERDPLVLSVRNDPRLDSLRNLPQFKKLMAQFDSEI